MIKYLKVKDNLYFVNQVINKAQKQVKVVESKIHHTFVVDCSGSMSGELQDIRRDMYNKISTLLKPSDSVTIIWFSGKNQYGVVLEDYFLKSGTSLNKVRELIERYLRPQGLTAFKQPLEEVKNAIHRISSKENTLHSMFFITDGCDNQYPEHEIMQAVKGLKDELNSATIVEYGYYCNRELMNKMATELGGVHTFSQDFQDYEPYMAKEFGKEFQAKKEYIKLEHEDIFGNVVFYLEDGEVISNMPNEKNEVALNASDGKNIFFLSTKKPSSGSFIGDEKFVESSFVSNSYFKNPVFEGLYMSLFAFSRKCDYNIVAEILKFLGDAKFIKEKANTFGTQKINELEAKFLSVVTNDAEKYAQGYNPDLEPAEDAFCVLDMIEELMSDENNLWYPRHDAFKYSRTTRKKVAKTTEISDEDKQKLTNLISSNDLSSAADKLKELQEKVIDELKFEFANEKPEGFPFMDLVWNETRANLSVRVNYQGFVTLPKNEFNIPEKFETNIFRNYTLIKDGIIHSYVLPVSLCEKTFNSLQANDLLIGETFEAGKIYVLNFSEIPVINRKMVKSMSAKNLFINQFELMKLQSKNSVFNYYKNSFASKLSKKFVELYGEKGTEWLSTLGLKEYGFNPASENAKDFEEILVNSLDVKVEKLSLISGAAEIKKIIQKIDEGKSLTPREELLIPAIKEFNDFKKLNEGIKDTKILESWLIEKSKHFRKEKTRLMTEISKAKFLTIVGKSWFSEFKDRSEKEMTLDLDGKQLKFIVEDKMETVKV